MYEQAINAANEAAYLYRSLRSKQFLAWRLYHKQNPHVYEAFLETAREAQQRGYEKWSIAGITEVVRWERKIQINGDTAFKIANDHATYYSRLLQMENPGLYGFFDTKKAAADSEMGWGAFARVMGRRYKPEPKKVKADPLAHLSREDREAELYERRFQ